MLTGTVTIADKSWGVYVAKSYTELTTGLSGTPSLPAGQGMLFDLAYDQSYITVGMSQMLFALDIIFINSTSGVVGVLRDVQAGEEVYFQAVGALGARYFLEVNAGEAEGVSVGDSVGISGEVQPAFWPALIVAIQALSVIAVTTATTYRVVKEEVKKGKEAK